ncbi:hypothetical protein HYT33_01360 [Candidatus Roizmanbacteria bacterium]|nr:hypothetical protein [Candidatus Roizmanbacteria bacterium]
MRSEQKTLAIRGAPQESLPYRIAELKRRALYEIPRPEILDWHHMSDRKYQALTQFLEDVYRETSSIGPANQSVADFESLATHIRMMQNNVLEVWKKEPFRALFPKGTNRNFIKSMCDIHDFSKLWLDGSFDLRYVDFVSEETIATLFPTCPTQYLHTIRWMTGEEESPDLFENPIPYVFKALDTISKPGRDPDMMFNPGEAHDGWLRRQKESGRFPLVFNYGGHVKVVTAEEYAERDKRFTLIGLELARAYIREKL